MFTTFRSRAAVRYVLSRSTIHHWSDPVKALREIHRVLEPQGVALVFEISRTANANAIARFNDMRRLASVEASRMNEKYTPEELWQFVRSAGLEAEAELLVPKMGLMSLGMELKISKK
jgi:ubiquinone/menaquinone biosynthesis C-methylase UbiE